MRKENIGSKKPKKFSTKQNTIVIPVVVFALISWIVFWLYPNLDTFNLAFIDVNDKFSFYNFGEAWKSFTSSQGELFISLKNTLTFFLVSLLINLPLTVFVCYFLYKRIYGFKFFRIVFYLPAILPIVTLTGVFKSFISVAGPLGKICETMGIILPNEGLLSTSSTAIPTMVVYAIWTGIAGSMLIISGSMARIPLEVLEAAKLDGCGIFRELLQIIIPLIWPTVATCITLSFAGLITAGGNLVMLLQPDTQYGTDTIYFWIYRQIQGGNGNRYSYGLVAATGLILTAVLVPLITFVRKVMDKFSVEY